MENKIKAIVPTDYLKNHVSSVIFGETINNYQEKKQILLDLQERKVKHHFKFKGDELVHGLLTNVFHIECEITPPKLTKGDTVLLLSVVSIGVTSLHNENQFQLTSTIDVNGISFVIVTI